MIVTDMLNTRKIPILRSAKHTQNTYSYSFWVAREADCYLPVTEQKVFGTLFLRL